MRRGGKVDGIRNFKRRVRSKDPGLDDSDEDYVIENEEVVSDEDDLEEMEESLDEYASEETFEEDGEVEESRKIVNSLRKRGSCRKARRGTKRKRVCFEEEEEKDDEDYVSDEEEEQEYLDENDDVDEEFTPDDVDEEFALDDDVDEEVDDLLDEDEGHTAKKKKKKKYNVKVGKRRKRNGGVVKGRRRKRRRKSRVSKKPSLLKGTNRGRLKNPVKRKKRTCKSTSKARRRTYVVHSDSDIEYTFSEEDREQAKKGSKLFSDQSSTSTKGKEKVKEIREEVVKQVCGVCLSEEDGRRLRGTLDCCNHFFCFTCIMEWSKVESRCPLCKHRFKTITKNGRSTMGLDLRNVVIKVPERNQVYQPSEEEIRSVTDPYESVVCSECHEGGDDGLMLLCDLCDSPAHTFCVGLGRQVPEGNWYCDGCRFVALGSSSTQAEDQTTTDQSMPGNDTFVRPPAPVTNMGDSSEMVIETSPRVASSRVFGNMSSPRFVTGDVQAASSVSGASAPTLSVRRQIHRHIQNLISMSLVAGRMDGVSASNLRNELSNSRIGQDGEAAIRNSSAQEIGVLHNLSRGQRSLPNNHSSTLIRDHGFLSSNPSQFRRQVVQNPTFTTPNRPVNLALRPELRVADAVPVNEQLHQYRCRSSTGSDGNFSHGVGDQNRFYTLKEQVQSMVKTHLRNLSQDTNLGYDMFKDVARSSTHTILAACGLEHRRSEVHNVPLPWTCNHADRLAAGEMSMMKDFCIYCFDSFVKDVVKRVLNTRLSRSLGSVFGTRILGH